MSTKIIKYLSELEMNNEREWYHSHKDELHAANTDFEKIIESLIAKISEFDPSVLGHEPKSLTFKLVRDTRFSNDKSPYNPTFRCHISSKGKLPIPVGYFIYISPSDRSFLGGGLFADMFKDATKMIRDYLLANADEFLSIINDPTFKELFTVRGEALKKVPADYPSDLPISEYLKYKSWFIEYNFSDDLLVDDTAFVEYSAKVFKAMKPFNDFLNGALIDFKMPTR